VKPETFERHRPIVHVATQYHDCHFGQWRHQLGKTSLALDLESALAKWRSRSHSTEQVDHHHQSLTRYCPFRVTLSLDCARIKGEPYLLVNAQLQFTTAHTKPTCIGCAPSLQILRVLSSINYGQCEFYHTIMTSFDLLSISGLIWTISRHDTCCKADSLTEDSAYTQ
jgi:hypothetical protein